MIDQVMAYRIAISQDQTFMELKLDVCRSNVIGIVQESAGVLF